MIRIELFGQALPRPLMLWRLGLEIQVWKFNLQINAGFSLLWNASCEKKVFRKSGQSVNRYFLFAGAGPLGCAAWMDP